ncbi:protein of unknown function [Kaistella chaponensis]|uniref:DUF4349 domain-containing protein n=1 Tax=Kaistella chaponensis TaxID=713588 RepID=A0A1N7LV28_9FLAO|nr:DUF4349 domain-containing protein [Kaistella chaponensis]SIS77690.1 protein of unknown function [Kaistella chaponensis]
MMLKKTIFSLFLLVFLNCTKTDKYSTVNASLIDVIPESPSKMETPPPPMEVAKNEVPGEVISPKKTDTISKKIIKNGDMEIAVPNLLDAKKKVSEIIKNNKAYLQSETFRNSDRSENINLVIRVPHQNFDAIINSFSDGIGAVEAKTVKAEDVTEEYTDVSIKLENKRIYLEKYREMLKNAASTKDMLEIQENIRALEDEIDVAEGRLRFIDDRVNYSTLELLLFKEKARTSATSKIGFGSRFGDSIAEGWNSFVSFLLGLISFWPFFIIIPLLIFAWKKWRRKK